MKSSIKQQLNDTFLKLMKPYNECKNGNFGKLVLINSFTDIISASSNSDSDDVFIGVKLNYLFHNRILILNSMKYILSECIELCNNHKTYNVDLTSNHIILKDHFGEINTCKLELLLKDKNNIFIKKINIVPNFNVDKYKEFGNLNLLYQGYEINIYENDILAHCLNLQISYKTTQQTNIDDIDTRCVFYDDVTKQEVVHPLEVLVTLVCNTK